MTSIATVLKRFQMTLVAIGLAVALTPAHAQTPTPSSPMGGHSMGQGGDMKARMSDRHSPMAAMKSTGNPDVDFAMMMREHHQGAITMSEAQLKNGKDPQMKKLAQAIIAAQKREIAVFDKYLAKHSDLVKK